MIQWIGLVSGFAAVSAVTGIAAYFIGGALADYAKYLGYPGAAYIVYLGVRLLFMKETAADGGRSECNFLSGFLVQLTNVKILLFCLSVYSVYVMPYTTSQWAYLAMGVLLPLTCPLCNLVWLFSGAALKGVLARHRRAVNAVMAISLFICAARIVWDLITK